MCLNFTAFCYQIYLYGSMYLTQRRKKIAIKFKDCPLLKAKLPCFGKKYNKIR